MKLAIIPPGEFTMGSPVIEPRRQPNEAEHRVKLPKFFYMGIHEVTQQQFERIMSQNPSVFKGGDVPVANVHWKECVTFCERLSRLPAEKAAKRSYRLPTEAEWEYACRAGTISPHSGGESDRELDAIAWYRQNSQLVNHKVGLKTPNAWGLFDMHGNVWEWSIDGFREYAPGTITVNPRGPEELSHPRVARGGGAGGAFASPPAECRSAHRQQRKAHDPGTNLGFRVICEISQRDASDSSSDRESDSLSRGLVAYYPFNGNGKDETGQGKDGIVVDAILTKDRLGRPNQAYAFDGTKSRIDLPDNLFGPDVSEASFAAWVSPNRENLKKSTTSHHILNKGASSGEMTMNLDEDGTVSCGVNLRDPGGWYSARTPIPESPTFFVVAVYQKGKRVQIWLNGNLGAETEIPKGSLHQSPGFHTSIGAYRNDNRASSLFQGVIDDVRVYDRALSAAEIKALYELESAPRIATTQVPVPAVAPFDNAKAGEYQNKWADHLNVNVETTNSVGMKLLLIPPGTFTMGSPASEGGRDSDELLDEDSVQVTLQRPFLMQQCEVTQAQWTEVMNSTPWQQHDQHGYFRQGANFPASYISWSDADSFCQRLTTLERKIGQIGDAVRYRLPTEAEWEFSCRAGSVTAYSFGDNEKDLDRFAWHGSNAWDAREMYPHQVGIKLPNAWQLYDMHGNMAEWSLDFYQQGLPGGLNPLVESNADLRRTLRCGGWASRAENNRSARRGGESPDTRTDGTGFRVVREIVYEINGR
jgi:formylglycine-generating enzyme required for sulfatase activity